MDEKDLQARFDQLKSARAIEDALTDLRTGKARISIVSKDTRAENYTLASYQVDRVVFLLQEEAVLLRTSALRDTPTTTTTNKD